MERTDTRERHGERAPPDPRRGEGGGDNETLFAVLAHVVPFPFEALFFVVDDDSEFVRYHAAHSLAYSLLAPVVGTLLFAVAMLVAFVVPLFLSVVGAALGGGAGAGAAFVGFAFLPLLLFVLAPVVGLGFLAIWLYFILAAVQGRRPRLPVVSRVADAIQGVAEDTTGDRRAPPAEGTNRRR